MEKCRERRNIYGDLLTKSEDVCGIGIGRLRGTEGVFHLLIFNPKFHFCMTCGGFGVGWVQGRAILVCHNDYDMIIKLRLCYTLRK